LVLELNEFGNAAGAAEHGPHQLEIVDAVIGCHQRVEIQWQVLPGVVGDDPHRRAGDVELTANRADDRGLHLHRVRPRLAPEFALFLRCDGHAAMAVESGRAGAQFLQFAAKAGVEILFINDRATWQARIQPPSETGRDDTFGLDAGNGVANAFSSVAAPDACHPNLDAAGFP